MRGSERHSHDRRVSSCGFGLPSIRVQKCSARCGSGYGGSSHRASARPRSTPASTSSARRRRCPSFWLLGKTQSGKTSIVRYLTGAERAEIGKGYQPCTRFTSKYVFPSETTPLLTFFDTRGLDEPGYDPKEDLAQLNDQAHVLLVVVKLLDHAQQTLMEQLPRIRAANPSRPVVLVLTCLHEAYPQQQHPEPYAFTPKASRPPRRVARTPAEPRGPAHALRQARRSHRPHRPDAAGGGLHPAGLRRPANCATRCSTCCRRASARRSARSPPPSTTCRTSSPARPPRRSRRTAPSPPRPGRSPCPSSI